MSYEVLTAASIKTAFFWAVALCSLINVAASIISVMSHRPDDGDRKLL
jgi:hypothetical protein